MSRIGLSYKAEEQEQISAGEPFTVEGSEKTEDFHSGGKTEGSDSNFNDEDDDDNDAPTPFDKSVLPNFSTFVSL